MPALLVIALVCRRLWRLPMRRWLERRVLEPFGRFELASASAWCAIGLVMFGMSPQLQAARSVPAVPVAGGEARVAINSDILSTNPGVLRDGNTDAVLYHIGESLVAYRDDLSVGPLLAQDILLSDDRRSYTFVLRAGVRFHNGAPLTAREVKWTWDRLLDPRTGFRCPEFYDGNSASGVKLERVEIVDERRVRFTLNKPSLLFLDRMANLQCQTPILHPASVDAHGGWRAPIGTGPYLLGEWRRGRSVTLERFEHYAARSESRTGLTGAKIAYLDRITFVVVPDRIAAKTAVYAGDIDLAFAIPLGANAEMRRRADTRRDIAIYHTATLDWTVLLLQTRDPLLTDVRMRRAIAHAIAVPLVTEASTFGLAQPNSSAVQSLSVYRTPAHEEWLAYDPALARKLAYEAGYRGETLVIQANRRFSYMFDNAVAIQAMLAAAGINARIEVTDWATQLNSFISGRFQLSSFGYSARSHPVLLYGNFIGPKQRQPSFQWDDREAIQLLAAAENANSTVEIGRNLDRLHELMRQQVPLIGLYNDHVVDVAKTSLRGYQPWVFGRPRLWGVWQARKEET